MLHIAGQHYRIHGDPAKGLFYLFKAARMPFPDRSVFNWHHLYKCLSKLELGRAVTSLGDDRVTLAELKEAAQLIGQVCYMWCTHACFCVCTCRLRAQHGWEIVPTQRI